MTVINKFKLQKLKKCKFNIKKNKPLNNCLIFQKIDYLQ